MSAMKINLKRKTKNHKIMKMKDSKNKNKPWKRKFIIKRSKKFYVLAKDY